MACRGLAASIASAAGFESSKTRSVEFDGNSFVSGDLYEWARVRTIARAWSPRAKKLATKKPPAEAEGFLSSAEDAFCALGVVGVTAVV